MNDELILVTGGTGFTGGHLCERLAAEGYRVRALVRAGSDRPSLEKPGVECVVGDLRDRPSLDKVVQGVDKVYHIAALFRPENVTRQDFWDTNVTGTQNLLEAATQANVKRFIHCSTIGVHGDIKHPPATEETEYGPGDDYQDSKTAGEKIALKYMAKGMAEGAMPVVVFRPGGIFGPGDRRFLKLFRGLKQGQFFMLGDGEVLYQLIYIDDLVEGILRCGNHPNAPGNVFILTGAAPITLNQFVQAVADVVGVPFPQLRLPVMPVYYAGYLCELLCKPLGINPPLYRRRVDFFRKTRSFDTTKARELLDFVPQTALKTALRKTADWYREQGYL